MLKCYAAEKNKVYIGNVLQKLVQSSPPRFDLARPLNVFEIASGTGEHAAHFSSILPNLCYQPTEPNTEMHESIVAWTKDFPSTLPPLELDILASTAFQLPVSMQKDKVDVIICINMIHISPFECTRSLFQFAATHLNKDGVVLTYGPYRVKGFMTESNIAFDESLKGRNSEWGVRDIEEVEEAALLCGLKLEETHEMPSNNLCLIFGRC